MNTGRIALFGLVVSASLLSPGCITFLGPEDLRLAVSLSSGVGLDREFGVGVDGLTLRMATSIAGVPVPLRGVTWVDVGIYKIDKFGLGTSESKRCMIGNIDLPGWEPIVRMRGGEDGVEAAVFVKCDGSSIRGIVVFARDGDELVIARLLGRIDKLIEGFLDSGELAKHGWPGLIAAAGSPYDKSTQVPHPSS